MIPSMRILPWRSLRLRLIVLLVTSVVCVLAAATALEIRLSTRLAERNLQERALTLAKEIDILLGSLWGRTDLRNFHHRLAEFARTHRNVADIEILLPVRDQWRSARQLGTRDTHRADRARSSRDGARPADLAAPARQLASRPRGRAVPSRATGHRRHSRQGLARRGRTHSQTSKRSAPCCSRSSRCSASPASWA